MDLRPTGDTGLDMMPEIYNWDELAVFLVVDQGVRARPDQRHFAGQKADELRQLIELLARNRRPSQVTRRIAPGCRTVPPSSRTVIVRNL